MEAATNGSEDGQGPERRSGIRPRGTLTLGLLGGIASGKSTAAAALAGEGGLSLSADALAHEVLAAGAERLVADFGPEVLGPDGRPDRTRLAERVFSDPEARALLESWIHPEVRATIRARLEEARTQCAPVVVLDVPLLLEHAEQHGLVEECDALVFIDTPDRARDARARADRGWAAGEVARREQAQLPLEEKRARADHVLTNDGTPDQLTQAAAALRARLLDA